MDTTIVTTNDNRPPRRPHHRREDVVRAVEELAGIGLKRDEIAHELGMATGCRGSLYMALLRAGRKDLWQAIKPPSGLGGVQVEPIRQEATRLLATLPEEDAAAIEQRRRDLLDDEDDQMGPAGRPVRGPGGIVRWVVAA
jgi:hypothetical protein